MAPSQAQPARRRLWTAIFVTAYVLLALPLWYRGVRVPRAPLPLPLLEQLELLTAAGSSSSGRRGAAAGWGPAAAARSGLAGGAAALGATLTAYVVCPGSAPSCPEAGQLPGLAAQLAAAVLREAGWERAEAQAPLLVRVLLDAPGRCTASSWIPPHDPPEPLSYTMPPELRRQEERQRRLRQLKMQLWPPLWPQLWREEREQQRQQEMWEQAQLLRQQRRQQWEQLRQRQAGGGGIGCLNLASSPGALRTVMGAEPREFDDWAAEQLGGQDRPGNYHLFIAPDPWLPPGGLPYGSMGRRRTALVRHSAGVDATHGSVLRLAALIAAPAFLSYLGGHPASPSAPPPPLPLNPAAQLHLSFSLCNAHPSPGRQPGSDDRRGGSGTHAGGGGGVGGAAAAAAAFVWSFAQFEAQFIGPVKQLLAPAARVTVSSQVLYFTPGRVNASWDERRRAFTLPYSQLPFFADSAWPLDPGRTGLPASAAGGGEVPYDVAAVPAGSRAVAIGEVMVLPPPQAGAGGRAAAAAAEAATASLPYLVPPPGSESLPPAVLNFVLYAPQPWQRPLLLLGPDGEGTPANSFWVPEWGMLQVLNQVPRPGQVLNQVPRPDQLVAPVEQRAMEDFAVEVVGRLRSLLGLGAARSRLLGLAAGCNGTETSSSETNSSSNSSCASSDTNSDYDYRDRCDRSSNPMDGTPCVGPVTLLSALRTGLAPWEVDALVRRRVAEDVRAAGATLGSLARLLRQVPTLAVPPHVGSRVAAAAGALQRAMRLAGEGRYEETSRSAQEARALAEAAFSDPALSPRLNVPDTHAVGVYLPFCLPAAVPLLQALLHELRKRWRELRRKREEERERRGGQVEAKEAAAEPGGEDGAGSGRRKAGPAEDGSIGSTGNAASLQPEMCERDGAIEGIAARLVGLD